MSDSLLAKMEPHDPDASVWTALGTLATAVGGGLVAFFTFRGKRLDSNERLLKTLSESVEKLSGELEETRTNAEAARVAHGAELEELRKQRDAERLADEQLRARERIEQMHRELALGNQIFGLQDQVTRLSRELDDERRAKTRLVEENAELRKQNTALAAEMHELRRDVTRSASERPAAVPSVGTSVRGPGVHSSKGST